MELSYECDLRWDDLKGDSPHRRYCMDCETYVYNVSAMTSAQKKELLAESRNELCVRFRMRDGRILHTDDPDAIRTEIKERYERRLKEIFQ